ncbi:MAG: glutamyl-tRNA reductase [Eubacteriales bacterium]|nr:glutamyl-tRNA reductase [Eubacteriales bacterium]
MSISMIGIDHNRAPVDIRALFAFTRKNAGEAMEKLKESAGIHGCIILSTCNRLELWASVEDGQEVSLYDCLCRLKGIHESSYKEFFVSREDQEAVEHLLYLTSGLKSQIVGEDQILTQVKDALSLAREHFTTDSVLEVLFRMAVTAGKRIKTEVPFSHGNPSVIHQAIQFLEKQGYSMNGKVCMVIGNGEMGKVAAQTLRESGGDVTVTVRQYRSGVVNIPLGCKRIDYGDRMEYLPQCDIVVSATASPNFTLREELFEDIELNKTIILIDLAVPRDIEPEVGRMEGVTLYDMDSFRTEACSVELSENLEAAGAIVREQMDEFYQWLDGRDVIPRIQEIKEEAVHDLNLRIAKILKNTPMEDTDRDKLVQAVDTAAGKVVNKLIFGLRDSLNQEAFLECVAGLEKIYEE